MKKVHPVSTEAAISKLFLSVFRLNGALLTSGDRLMRDLGLTSARWQVIGAISASPVSLPIASIARNMGLTRQGVRTVAIDLEKVGLVRFVPNPHHRRAHLVELTPEGVMASRAAKMRQLPWAGRIGRGFDLKSIEDAAAMLHTMLLRLEKEVGTKAQDSAGSSTGPYPRPAAGKRSSAIKSEVSRKGNWSPIAKRARVGS